LFIIIIVIIIATIIVSSIQKFSINELIIRHSPPHTSGERLIDLHECNFVVYDKNSEHSNQLEGDSLALILLEKLAQKFKSVSFLICGFERFHAKYPNLCEQLQVSSMAASSTLSPSTSFQHQLNAAAAAVASASTGNNTTAQLVTDDTVFMPSRALDDLHSLDDSSSSSSSSSTSDASSLPPSPVTTTLTVTPNSLNTSTLSTSGDVSTSIGSSIFVNKCRESLSLPLSKMSDQEANANTIQIQTSQSSRPARRPPPFYHSISTNGINEPTNDRVGYINETLLALSSSASSSSLAAVSSTASLKLSPIVSNPSLSLLSSYPSALMTSTPSGVPQQSKEPTRILNFLYLGSLDDALNHNIMKVLFLFFLYNA
jgi:hypothetical protein